MKTCSCCNIKKQLCEFNKNRFTKDGYQCHCKECVRIRRRNSRKTNIGIGARHSEYIKYKYNALWREAKKRATKNNLEFNLDKTDINIPDYCPILNIKLSKNNNKQSDNSASLDRIDNTKGYVKGNIMVISWRANRLKSDATLQELQSLVSYIETYCKK